MISERAAEIFGEASTMDPDTRVRFVTDACGTDGKLLQEVNALLTAANQSEGYFQSLAQRVSLSAAVDDDAIYRGKTIGRWRLVEPIGRGGMGAVYLAERVGDQFEQQAAVKILPASHDSEQARARFIIERKILARLVHDNIARLLDGGVTDDGVPYFVMDFVAGIPIDEYCVQHALSVENRVELILEVTEAVQYAHRNLVIHRDLKPSNVLVTEEGRVRLLDFGIAKLLEPGRDGELTRAAQRPVTPAYSSPEMLRGEPVDVTTDVYSIGALTYCLLTGQVPVHYENMSLPEMCEHAAHATPLPVRRHNDAVHADLEAIVGKALGKRPEDRYSSVESLAADLRAFLDGMPVRAKAPSSLYRARRFVGRHRAGVAFASVTFLSLALIAGLASYSAIRSEEQARQIALERDRAGETIDFLVSIFDSADPNMVPGNQTAIEILENGRRRVESELGGQPALQAEMLQAMSLVYQSLRMHDEALEVMNRERELRATLNGTRSADYADVLIRLAQTNDIAGNYEASIDYAGQSLAISELLGDRSGEAAAHTRIGRVMHLRGDYEGAGTNYRAALDKYVELFGADSLQVSQTRSHLGNLLNHQKNFDAAIVEFEEALRIRRLHYSDDNSEISEVLLGLGQTLTNAGRLDEAEDTLQTAYAMNERLFGADNSYNMYLQSSLGKLAEQRGEFDLAISRFEDALRLVELYTPESPNRGIVLAYIGRVNLQMGRLADAIGAYRKAVPILEAGIPGHWMIGDVRWRLGRCLIETGEFAESEELIMAGLDVVQKQWGADDQRTIDARAAAALLYRRWGKEALAEAYATR